MGKIIKALIRRIWYAEGGIHIGVVEKQSSLDNNHSFYICFWASGDSAGISEARENIRGALKKEVKSYENIDRRR